MRRLSDSWLRLGVWLRTNPLLALSSFLAFSVSGSASVTSVGDVAGYTVQFVFMFLAIMTGIAYLQGGR